MVQFAQIEWLVQKADCPLDQRVVLPPAVPVSAHHEDRRIHAQVADAFEQVEALSPEHGIAYSGHDHVQQNEVEALTLQDGERVGDRLRRRDLISVPVLEGGEGLPQYIEHSWLVVDDEDALRFLRVDCHFPFGPRVSALLGKPPSGHQLDGPVLFNPLQCLPRRPLSSRASKEGADGLHTSLTSSTSPRDPGTDQTEQHTRDDHGDREPNEGESQALQIGHWTVPPGVIEACRSADPRCTTATCPIPAHESSQERSACRARSYEGMEHPAKPLLR